MSKRAWAYIWSVLLAGAVLSGLTLSGAAQTGPQWLTFVILTALASLAQLFKAETPNHQLYYATMIFLFAGVLLLHPSLFVLLVVVPHLIEWGKERWLDSPHLRDWYIQPFNIAVHIIAGSAARWVHVALDTDTLMSRALPAVLAVTAAALIYVLVNHGLIGLALVLGRGISLRESGVLDIENLLSDLIQLYLGYVVAVLWVLNPWLILPALSPLVLIYRALTVPQLRQAAQTDGKTGLWNAHHFARLFTAEMERAKRFERPLALIMADLDLLRNINNTYGHLAGDVVLARIGQIIRDTIREYDIAGRFGGEEFAIVLPETELVEVQSLAERLRRAVESARFEVKTSPTPIQATMSLGVACFPADATQTDDLVHEADVAVYQAKLQGRNRVVSAADVPHHIKLESTLPEDRLKSAYAAAFTPRPKLGAADATSVEGDGTDSSAQPDAGASPTPLERHGQASSARPDTDTPATPVEGDAQAGSATPDVDAPPRSR
ncbi:MAG: diguanylate cyclase [Anaerolineae bacterium]